MKHSRVVIVDFLAASGVPIDEASMILQHPRYDDGVDISVFAGELGAECCMTFALLAYNSGIVQGCCSSGVISGLISLMDRIGDKIDFLFTGRQYNGSISLDVMAIQGSLEDYFKNHQDHIISAVDAGLRYYMRQSAMVPIRETLRWMTKEGASPTLVERVERISTIQDRDVVRSKDVIDTLCDCDVSGIEWLAKQPDVINHAPESCRMIKNVYRSASVLKRKSPEWEDERQDRLRAVIDLIDRDEFIATLVDILVDF